MRTGTGRAAGCLVRPASDRVTPSSRRPARRAASWRASSVPPRMRMRMAVADRLDPESAAARRWLSIVGIGEDGIEGLSPAARTLVTEAEIVFGGKRHLA